MGTESIRAKYTGIQSEMKRRSESLGAMGDGSCLFLCLCSIAEEFNEGSGSPARVDILDAALRCMNLGHLGRDWTCVDQEGILGLLTGRRWRRSVVRSLPRRVPANVYTVEKWHNERTGYDHFRRRWGDTLVNSITVREGNLVGYYTYTHEGA